jgi:hypothetical protein
MRKPIKPTNAMLDALAERDLRCPRVFVETGTYLGGGVERAIGHFEHIHSIEIVEEFARNGAIVWREYPEVTIHHADSGTKVAELARQIDEPVLWHLDAHYSGGKTAFGVDGDQGWPLLREMRALAGRSQDDVIVIDDVRMLGRAMWSGSEGDPIYPRTFFDFTHLTLQDVLRAYGRPVRLAFAGVKGHDWLILQPAAPSIR